MPIKPPAFYSGGAMQNPFTYASIYPRSTPPEEAFDRILDAYAHNFSERARGPNYERPSQRIEINAIPVEDARRMFVDYVSHFESFYRSVSQALNDHMAICTSPPPIFMQMRTQDLRHQFSQGYVVNADRRSGKTTALFDEADEVSRATSSRIAIVAPRKEYVMAEACRRRLANATPGQFNRLEFIGEDELHKLDGLCRDVMVDEWWGLSERTREILSSGRFNIMAAVGTVAHGARIPITNHAVRDEAGFLGINPDKYNAMAMARISSKDRG